MKYRKLPKIQIDEHHLPYRWQDNLVKNQEIGGVFLLFLSGKNNKEIDMKIKLIRKFCKSMKGYCKDFATVK